MSIHVIDFRAQWNQPAHPSVTFILGDYRSSGPTRGGYRIGRPALSILVRRSIGADQFLVHRCEAEPVADQVGH